jgi:hypothetical protein
MIEAAVLPDEWDGESMTRTTSSLLRAATRVALELARDLTARAVTDPVFVLGHQKSGTTAIAALFAELVQRRYSNDMISRRRWRDARDIVHGRVSIDVLVQRAPSEFGAGVIKDPDLTFRALEIAKAFPQAHLFGVVRDPRTTIRSILDRLELPGDREVLDLDAAPVLAARPGWRLLFEPELLGMPPANYVEALAARWCLALECIEMLGDRCMVVRYEDFLADKLSVLRAMAAWTALPAGGDVAGQLDQQFQRRTRHRGPVGDFFGTRNLARIEAICGKAMARYGYPVEADP